MLNASAKLMGLALATVLVASCAREAQAPQSPAPARPKAQQRRPAPPADSATAYVAAAAAMDLYEIRSSELALQRSSNARVREFASMMLRAHRGTSAQLSLAGRRLNLLPSAVLPARQQAMLDSLQTGANFDALYRQQQVSVHQEALTLHRSYAARGTSPTLRPVAAAMVPIIERHLRMLRYL